MRDKKVSLSGEKQKAIGVVFYDYSVKAGGQRVAANVFNYLCGKGYRIIFISVFSKNGTVSFELDGRISVFFLNDGEGHFRKVLRSSIKSFGEIVDRENIGVLLAEGFSADMITAIVSKKRNIPFLHCEHTSLENKLYSDSLASKVYRYVGVCRSKAIIALTEANKISFENKYRSAKGKVVVIPNWVEKPDNAVTYNPDAYVILSIGRADPVKGYDRLIEVASRIKTACVGWEWQIWGNFDNEYGQSIRQMIHERELEDFVKLKGSTENVNEVYANSGLFVLTSYFEGLPMVLLEASVNRIPLLSFDIATGPNEIIVDGVNGYLINDADLEEMSDRIRGLVLNKNERIRLSENSWINLTRFEKERVAEEWHQLLSKFV